MKLIRVIHIGIRMFGNFMRDIWPAQLLILLAIAIGWLVFWAATYTPPIKPACQAANSAVIGVSQRDPQDAQEVIKLMQLAC